MNDKIFYPLAGIAALALIALSLVWPQGLGMPSPKPFGHALELPDQFRMMRERSARLANEAAQKAEIAKKKAAALKALKPEDAKTAHSAAAK